MISTRSWRLLLSMAVFSWSSAILPQFSSMVFTPVGLNDNSAIRRISSGAPAQQHLQQQPMAVGTRTWRRWTTSTLQTLQLLKRLLSDWMRISKRVYIRFSPFPEKAKHGLASAVVDSANLETKTTFEEKPYSARIPQNTCRHIWIPTPKWCTNIHQTMPAWVSSWHVYLSWSLWSWVWCPRHTRAQQK